MKKDASRFSPKGVLFHRTFFTAPAFFIRSPSGFEWFGLRFAPVGAPATPGRPQDDRALSWTLKMTGNPLKKCDFRFFYAKNDLCQLNTAFSNCCKFCFCNSFSFRTSNHSNFPTVQKN